MKKRLYSIWLCFLTVLSYCFRIFPINKYKVLLSNFAGKGFGDNSKYLAIKLHEINTSLRFCWIIKGEDDSIPGWIKPVKLNSIASVFAYATSKIWIDNSRKPLHITKRKGQYYIQTWHGGLGIKRVENDTVMPLPDSWIKASKHDSSMVDYMISNSTFCTQMYKRAFWYDGPILECGSPRNDILFSADKGFISLIKERIGISQDAFVVLYAPTFRSDLRDVYDLDPHEVRTIYGKRENRNVEFLVRMHPLVDASKCAICKRDDVIDVSAYPDMCELMLISDVLITDYSSSMFEISLTGKEVQLYAKDLSVFTADRGSYYELSEIPFPISTSLKGLYQNINAFSPAEYKKRVIAFFEGVGVCESGMATETVSNLIISLIEK